MGVKSQWKNQRKGITSEPAKKRAMPPPDNLLR